MENRKLWIIGDSFTGTHPKTWTFKICEQFIGEHYYVSSQGSRDIQTIFDIFLHKLHKIQPNDIVILFLPTLSRFRLPLETPYIDVEWSDDLDNKNRYKYELNDWKYGVCIHCKGHAIYRRGRDV